MKSYELPQTLVNKIDELSHDRSFASELLILPCLPPTKVKKGWSVYYLGYQIGDIYPQLKLGKEYFSSGKIAKTTYVFSLNIWIAEALRVLEIPFNSRVEQDKIEYLFATLYNSYIPGLKEALIEVGNRAVDIDEIPF